MDVTARRGAESNTDHHLVNVKLRLKRASGGRVNRCIKSRRFDMGKLRVQNEEEVAGDEQESVKRKYFQGVHAGES